STSRRFFFTFSFSLVSLRSAPTSPSHSFPTRRSSDLRRPRGGREAAAGDLPARRGASAARRQERRVGLHTTSALPLLRRRGGLRSEEHTSELQSRFDLVCRLLLEKKSTTTFTSTPYTT